MRERICQGAGAHVFTIDHFVPAGAMMATIAYETPSLCGIRWLVRTECAKAPCLSEQASGSEIGSLGDRDAH